MKPGRLLQITQGAKALTCPYRAPLMGNKPKSNKFVASNAIVEPRWPLIHIAVIVPYKDLSPKLKLLEIVFE